MSFSAGFSRKTITPDPGLDMCGYYVARVSEGALDDLQVNTAALSAGDETLLIIGLDLHYVMDRSTELLRSRISEAAGLPQDHIFIHFNHTHTAPSFDCDSPNPKNRDYFEKALKTVSDSVLEALSDMKAARVGYGSVDCSLSHSRRVLMKDGTVVTNPGVNNPDSIWEVGEVDNLMSAVRIDRDEADTILLINYSVTPDSVGGNLISADCIGFMRSTVETCIPGVKCLFLNGAHGDSCMQPVFAEPGWFNGTSRQFDDVMRGYDHSRWCGRYMAGSVIKIYDKVSWINPEKLRAGERIVKIQANIPLRKELPEARRIHNYHESGRDAELGYSGMMLTTVVAEAERKLRLSNAPKIIDVPIIAAAIGPIVLVGVAAEPFSGFNMAIRDTKEWAAVLPVSIVNGRTSIIPMKEDYEEGGYEARASAAKAGSAELIISECKLLISDLK
ncbi:MAG: hypothetical protein IJS22_04090 [Lachnospiraceae bacterium]|nr:hypothetical protein [Lachnospiraceae bacterium]